MYVLGVFLFKKKQFYGFTWSFKNIIQPKVNISSSFMEIYSTQKSEVRDEYKGQCIHLGVSLLVPACLLLQNSFLGQGENIETKD